MTFGVLRVLSSRAPLPSLLRTRSRSKVAVIGKLVPIRCGVLARMLLDTRFHIHVSNLASRGPLRLEAHDTSVFQMFQSVCGNQPHARLQMSANGASK